MIAEISQEEAFKIKQRQVNILYSFVVFMISVMFFPLTIALYLLIDNFINLPIISIMIVFGIEIFIFQKIILDYLDLFIFQGKEDEFYGNIEKDFQEEILDIQNENNEVEKNISSQLETRLIYSLEDGLEFYRNKNYNLAYKVFKNFTHNSQANFYLGWLYENGRGVKKNYQEALRWYKLGANRGNVNAQYNLGIIYYEGQKVGRNYNEALEYFKFAANQGNSDAQNKLGIMYENAQGVSQDYEQALEYYQLAANQSNETAQSNLNSLKQKLVVKEYFAKKQSSFKYKKEKISNVNRKKGDVVKIHNKNINNKVANKELTYEDAILVYNRKDYKRAYKMFEELANKNDIQSQIYLALMNYKAQGVEQNYEKAYEHYSIAAKLGNVSAQNSLGLMYESGLGVKKNYKEAMKWYHLAADQGNLAAQNSLDSLYQKLVANTDFELEDGVKAFEKKDYKTALKIFKNLAINDEKEAFYYIAKMSDEALGTPKNQQLALRYYELAANFGDLKSQFALANKYANGDGVNQDYKKALEYYQLGANQEDVRCLSALGILYLDGKGVEQDYQKAMGYFNLAAKQNDKIALRKLGMMYYMGYGDLADLNKSFDYLQRAAKLGDKEAKESLAILFKVF